MENYCHTLVTLAAIRTIFGKTLPALFPQVHHPTMFHPLLHETAKGTIEVFQGADLVLTNSLPIAISSDDMRVVTLDCSLAPLNDVARTWEFSFAVTCTALDESELPFTTQDRTIAAFYIPAICRPLIMPSVCYVAQCLVKAREPRQIYRVEKLINPPPGAARKHELITTALESVGYTLAESGYDNFGRRFRVMTRASEEVSDG